tara:strand:+ start:541 stop:960 length:420 start_codon:yes stop_codon:yes gene_type:complete
MDKKLDFLVIDNEITVREMIGKYLESLSTEKEVDVSVTLAEDGKEGLREYFKKIGEGYPYDCVLTDLNMPGVDGADVTRAIKQVSTGKTLVYVITGGEGTVVYENLLLKLGSMAPDGIIPKPFGGKELEEILDKVMDYS